MKKSKKILQTKENILNSAEKLFAEKGFDGTGVTEIAEYAGVPKSLIYYYFTNKEDILYTLIDRLVGEVLEFKMTHLKFRTPEVYLEREGMMQVLNLAYEFYYKRKQMCTIIYQEALKNEIIGKFLMKLQISQEEIIDYFENSGFKVEEVDLKLGHFFLVTIPFLLFIVYSEKWCQRNTFEYKEVKDTFFLFLIDIMYLLFGRIVKID